MFARQVSLHSSSKISDAGGRMSIIDDRRLYFVLFVSDTRATSHHRGADIFDESHTKDA